MLLVQLSDLHVGSQFQGNVFDTVVQEVNELKPDAIIISGDLTNEGLFKEYEQCKQLISRFETKKIICISGNHDYRNSGYLIFKKFFPLETITELDKDTVLVTLGTARPDRNEGEVGYRQNLWLERTMRKYKDRIKIVAMHHHLIGIPDTGSDWVTVIDAGDVLRTILDNGVDLILCGHRHRPWMWNLGNLIIVNAGTASSDRARGLFENTYNIIEINDKKIKVDLKTVGGKRRPIEDLVKNYTTPNEE
ncbi:MAG: metallophosphoesterase [Nitrosopumilaceae archaeon]|nr:metallophosphoesterase [Nitrosopumilaceae archaeon]NIT99446.1 metallophosphoesterase [Nitrosopumilaceae archaeon]NIU85805.1 metallophosphoesterase [Nitrosopumilaceae archaeon]NIV64662.1 metallophosphoesterase [Nitrosopumilaceae archaeon]NIX60049.1 metallophosphoesterase [Nitrosopumilaceae archaeon]